VVLGHRKKKVCCSFSYAAEEEGHTFLLRTHPEEDYSREDTLFGRFYILNTKPAGLNIQASIRE
jgi:hypothetical protein